MATVDRKTGIIAAFVLCLNTFAGIPEIRFSYNRSLRADFGGTEQKTEEAVGNYGEAGVQVKQISGTDRNIKQQLLPGVSGMGLKLGRSCDGKANQIFMYDLSAAKLSPAGGTVSFWIRPLDWDGRDKNFHNFISLRGTTRLFINYTPNREISFSLIEGKKNSTVRKTAVKWQKGAWHHIAAAWDKKIIQLYIDGVPAGAMENRISSEKNYKQLILGEYWAGDPGSSVIDELQIFSGKLAPEKIRKLYEAHQNIQLSNAAPLEFTVAEKSVKTDGVIGVEEYSFSAEGFRTVAKGTAVYSSIQNRWYCAWDDKFFYAALKAPGGRLLTSATKRDSHVYDDDCVEFFIQHPVNKKIYQFIFNSRGTVFDSFGGDPAWNSKQLRCASRADKNNWQIEFAIPWQDVNIVPADGMQLRMNLCRSIRIPKRGLSIVPLPNNAYNDPPNFAAVTLKKISPEIHFAPFGKLFNGMIDSQAALTSPADDRVTAMLDVDSQLQPLHFKKSFSIEGRKKQTVPLKGSFRKNNILDISLRSEKYGTLYRTGLDVRETTPARYSFVHTDLEKQEIVITCENAAAGGEKSLLRVTLTPAKGGKKVMDKTVSVPNDKLSVQCRFPLNDIPCGEYKLEYYLSGTDGKVYAQDWEYYGRFSGRERRFNATAGLEDTIPAPFTRPVAGKNTYSCWSRKIRFGEKGLISSIISSGKEMLSGEILFKINGKSINFKPQLIRKNNCSAEYLLTPVTAPFPFKINMRAEFDGLLYFTVVLPAGKTVNSAELFLPLDRRYVDSYDDCASIFYRHSLDKVKQKTFLQNPAENHFFWLGNYDRGIMGGNENMRNWYLKNKQNGYQLDVSGTGVCMTMRFIDTPLKTEKERRFSFYLQPTPVRPLRSAALRKIRMENNPFVPEKVPYINANMWQPYYTDLFDHKNKDFITVPKSLARYCENARSGKWRVFWYCAPKGTSPYSYEWNYWGEDWIEPEPALGNYRQDLVYTTREAKIKGIWTNACLKSRSFFNFKLRQLEDFINAPEFHASDLYFDLGWPRKCGNAFHGCAWTDEFGYQHRNYDLFALREFNLRMVRHIQKKRPDAMLLGHLQQTRTPADSFYDLLIFGEPYNHRIYLNGGNYYDILTPELAKIAYGYRSREALIQFGPNLIRPYSLFAPDKLKTYDARKPENDAAILHLLGYVMVNGLETCEMYPGHGTKRFIEWRAAQDSVGWDENLIFHPYWEKSGTPAVQAAKADDKVLISSYINPKTGKAAAAVLNDQDKTVSCHLLLDAPKLTGTGNKLICRSVFENKTFAPIKKGLDLVLKPRQFIMLTIESAQ